MPMIDVYMTEGALDAQAESALLEELTEILIRHEGLDPADRRVRGVTWIFVHRPRIYRAEITEAVARAEGRNVEDVSGRVWIFPTEIPDGGWGSRGAIQRLPDIMAYFGGEPIRGSAIQRLKAKRRQGVIPILEAIVEAVKREAGTTVETSRGPPDSCQRRGESTACPEHM